MREPLVTIALPVFNGEDFLEQALCSLLSQDYRNLELLILDNCSTDKTEQICRSYAEADRRIRYHKHSVNLGWLENFNSAVYYARGEYFMYAAHDDLWEPNYLSELLKILQQDAAIGLAFTRLDFIDESGRIFKNAAHPPDLKGAYSLFRNFLNYLMRFHYDYIVYGLYRSSMIKQTLPFHWVGGKTRHSTADFLFRFLGIAKARGSRKVLFHYRTKNRDIDVREGKRLDWVVTYIKDLLLFLLGLFRVIHAASFLLPQKLLLQFSAAIVISFWLLRMITLASLPRQLRISIKTRLKDFRRHVLFITEMENQNDDRLRSQRHGT